MKTKEVLLKTEHWKRMEAARRREELWAFGCLCVAAAGLTTLVCVAVVFGNWK